MEMKKTRKMESLKILSCRLFPMALALSVSKQRTVQIKQLKLARSISLKVHQLTVMFLTMRNLRSSGMWSKNEMTKESSLITYMSRTIQLSGKSRIFILYSVITEVLRVSIPTLEKIEMEMRNPLLSCVSTNRVFHPMGKTVQEKQS